MNRSNLIIKISEETVYDLNWFYVKHFVNNLKLNLKRIYYNYEFWFNQKFNGD